MAKAPAATVDIVTPNTAVDIVTPVSDNAGHGEDHLVLAQGSGSTDDARADASKLTSSDAFLSVRRFPCGRSTRAWSTWTEINSLVAISGDITLPQTPPGVPVGGDRGLCGMPGSGLLNSEVNPRLFRLIGTEQLRLAGQTCITTWRKLSRRWSKKNPFGGADCPSRSCDPSSGSCKSHWAW